MQRLKVLLVVLALLGLVLVLLFSCSSSESVQAPEQTLSLKTLSDELALLKSDLTAEINQAKRTSLLLFVFGLGLGILGFGVIQYQIKRFSLKQAGKASAVKAKSAKKSTSKAKQGTPKDEPKSE